MVSLDFYFSLHNGEHREETGARSLEGLIRPVNMQEQHHSSVWLSALQFAGNQTKVAVRFSNFLLVSGLDQPKHDLRQGQASWWAPHKPAVLPNTLLLAPHGADEVRAHFSLALTHLQKKQRYFLLFKI